MDAVEWTEKNTLILNWACGVLTVVGLILQYAGHRWGQWLIKSSGAGKKPDDKSASWFAIGPIALRKAG